ncbi:hypothetical protein EGW08_012160, partial [Elysia chlorotica]
LFWEIPLELYNALAPVGRAFLADQFNVEERALARSVNVSTGRASHDSRRHVGHTVLTTHIIKHVGFGKSEAPPGLEGAADHGGASGGRGRGQAERVGEADAADLHRDVHRVDGRVEVWQGWLHGDLCVSALADLEKPVHVPGGDLAVIDGLHCGLRHPGDVPATENICLAANHGRPVNLREAPLID